MNQIELLRKELADISLKIEALANVPVAVKPTLNKWYKYNGANVEDSEMLVCPTEWVNNGFSGFGFTHSGNWNDNNSWYQTSEPELDTLTPAAPEEIKSALVKEAKKRGFKEGVKFGSVNSNTLKVGGITWEISERSSCEYNSYEDVLCWGGNIYCRGVWAEIVKDQPITIGGETVVYDPIHANGAKTCQIKNEVYSHDDLSALHGFLWAHADQVKSINVGCSGQYRVTLEDINKILKGFK